MRFTVPWSAVARRRAERGQAAVEAALILPIVILILLLTIDLGRAYFSFVELRNAAREASMFGSGNPTVGCTSDLTFTGLRYAVAKELQVSPSDIGCGTGGQVQVTASGADAVGCYRYTAPSTYSACSPAAGPWNPTDTLIYRVRLSRSFQPITPVVGLFTGNGFGGSVPMSVRSASPVLKNYGS